MSKHTPGPWRSEWSDQSPTLRIFGANDRPIVKVHVYASLGGDEDLANSRLITAAPELLEALQYIVQWNASDWNAERAREQALAAIAKATGEAVPQ